MDSRHGIPDMIGNTHTPVPFGVAGIFLTTVNQSEAGSR